MEATLIPLASVLAGVLPTLLYVWIIWRLDRYEKEPPGLLVAAFLWGAVPAVILALLAEVVLGQPLVLLSQGMQELVGSSLVAPPVEELCKGLALWGLFVLARDEFDGLLDGIVYGSIIGFGFAMTENVFYFVGAWEKGGLSAWSSVVLGRGLAFGFNHAMFTALAGIGFGLARYQRASGGRFLWVVLGLAAAVLVHFIHNFFLSAGGFCLISFLFDWFGVLVVFAIVLLAWRREHTIMRQQLAEEVDAGLLSPMQFETVVSRRGRLRQQWLLLGISGWQQARLYRQLVATATELAFKKHQQRSLGDEKHNGAQIAALRARLVTLRARLGDPIPISRTRA